MALAHKILFVRLQILSSAFTERIHVPTLRKGLGLLRLTFALFNSFAFLYT